MRTATLQTARVDVAVIGAGPAGCALANHLNRKGAMAALITLPKAEWETAIPETIPPGLCESDFWPVSRRSLRPQHAMATAWGTDCLSIRHSIMNPLGHGWFVDRAILDREMLGLIVNSGTFVVEGKLAEVAGTSSGWRLRLQTGSEVEAAFVADASGRSSCFARKIGVVRRAMDRLVAMSMRATAAEPIAGEALLESSEGGWWFSAPLAGGELSVSFFSDPGKKCLPDEIRSTNFTAGRVADFLRDRVRVRTARTDYLEVAAGERWLALGDAAIATDPLASQGLERALVMARKAAETFSGWSFGSQKAAKEYREFHEESLQRFLRERHSFYGMERRWPSAPFWKARLGALS